jgi:hypothetical protein
MERAGTSDMDGEAARAAARELEANEFKVEKGTEATAKRTRRSRHDCHYPPTPRLRRGKQKSAVRGPHGIANCEFRMADWEDGKRPPSPRLRRARKRSPYKSGLRAEYLMLQLVFFRFQSFL